MSKMTEKQATIKVDVDNAKAPPSIGEICRILRRAGYEPEAVGIGRSPSGEGFHVVLHVSPRPSSPYEVVALQLLLGGDREREAVQMFRARMFGKAPSWMRDHWNVLYLPNDKRERHCDVHRFAAKGGAVVDAAPTRQRRVYRHGR